MSASSHSVVATQDNGSPHARTLVIPAVPSVRRLPRRRRHTRAVVGVIVRVALVALAVVTAHVLMGADVVPLERMGAIALPSTLPAIHSDFADPAVLVVGNEYYAYATNAAGKHVQVARSNDLTHWTLLPDALPTLPAWVDGRGAWVWAPDVIQIGSRFVMYYTARDARSQRQCIGVATSAAATGPFSDATGAPFVCQRGLGGDIDASPFRDGSALYLYFKSDGNCCDLRTHLWGQRLSADGLHLLDAPTLLLTNDQQWEGDVVEAPNMVKNGASYGLFYSGNDYATQRYAIGYARCASPLGPCVKPNDHPILATNLSAPMPLIGPGGASIFEAGGLTWIAFHTWGVTIAGAPLGARYMLVERLEWHGDQPTVFAPGAPDTLANASPATR